MFFLGINDCGRTDADDLESVVEIMFDAAHDLYTKAGARNFVCVGTPPMDRFPGGQYYLISYLRVDYIVISLFSRISHVNRLEIRKCQF